MRVVLVCNPKAGLKGPECPTERILGVLEGWEWEAEVLELGGEGTDAAIRDAASRCDVMLVAGGDGTIHRVANLLVGTKVRLGILPLGTGNDLARSLGLPLDPLDALYVVRDGLVHPIDMGVLNGHYFLNVAALGVSAEACAEVTPVQKERLGKWAYYWNTLRKLARAERVSVRLITPEGTALLDAYQISVANGRSFGGGWRVAEEARLDDQLLDIVAVEPEGRGQMARALVRRGGLKERAATRSWRQPWCRIETDGPIYVNLDGEPFTAIPPLEFRVVPAALQVYAPRAPLGRIDATGLGIHQEDGEDLSMKPTPAPRPIPRPPSPDRLERVESPTCTSEPEAADESR